MRFLIAFICIVFFASPCFPKTPTRPAPETRESLRVFVQEFYDWYVPKFWKNSPKLAVNTALSRRYLFKPELAEALQRGLPEAARCSGLEVPMSGQRRSATSWWSDAPRKSRNPSQPDGVQQYSPNRSDLSATSERAIGTIISSREGSNYRA